MPGANSDDVGAQGATEKGNVSEDIENLVADELVFESQWLLGQNFVAFDHNRTVEAASLDFSEFEQLLEVFVDGEGACRGDLGDIDIRVDFQREVLCVDTPVVGGSAGDLECIAGESYDGAVPFRNGDMLFQGEEPTLLVFLFDGFSLLNEVYEMLGGTVEDRRLTGTHLDDDVVHLAAAQCAQDVFDSVDLCVPGGEGGTTDQFSDQGDVGFDLGFAVEIGPTEDDAGVFRCGFQGQGNLLAGMEGFSADGSFAQDRALFHGIVRNKHRRNLQARPDCKNRDSPFFLASGSKCGWSG